MVGHAGIPHGAEKHGVELLQLLEAVLRHHAAGLGVDLATPVEMRHLIREAEFLSGCFEDAQPFGDDFVADAIALYDSDFESGHSKDSISSYPAMNWVILTFLRFVTFVAISVL